MTLKLKAFEEQTQRLKLAGLSANTDSTGIPIIAIHGWLDNAASFIPLAQELETGRPFYAVEMPGHGLSESRPENTSYHLVENVVDIIAFIRAVLNRASTQAQVTLVGHSLGGIIATLVAASAPELVNRLILLDSLGPLTDDVSNVLPQLRKAVAKASAVKSGRKTIFPSKDKAVKARMLGVGRVSQEAAMLLCDRGLLSVSEGYVWASDSRLLEPSFVRFSEEQVKEIFSGVECPVLVLRGSEGYFSAYSAIKKRLDYFKQIEQQEVEGGHHFHMDGDVSTAARILDDYFGA